MYGFGGPLKFKAHGCWFAHAVIRACGKCWHSKNDVSATHVCNLWDR